MAIAITGPLCVLEPFRCPGLAEIWPWLLGGIALLALPVMIVALFIHRRDR